jgi:hypothetical protein
LEPNSNETEESELDHRKEHRVRTSTFRGISIDLSDESENASDSIRFNDDGDSNEIDENDLQDEKHDDPRIVTNAGIIGDLINQSNMF